MSGCPCKYRLWSLSADDFRRGDLLEDKFRFRRTGLSGEDCEADILLELPESTYLGGFIADELLLEELSSKELVGALARRTVPSSAAFAFIPLPGDLARLSLGDLGLRLGDLGP